MSHHEGATEIYLENDVDAIANITLRFAADLGSTASGRLALPADYFTWLAS